MSACLDLPQPRVHGLSHRAVALHRLLIELGAGSIASYDRLRAALGSSARLVGDAARELEEAGLIARERVAAPSGARRGPHTPYRWTVLAELEAPEGVWLEAGRVEALAAERLAEIGARAYQVLVLLTRHPSAPRLALARAELEAVTGMERRTAERALNVLVGQGAGVRSLVVTEKPKLWLIELGEPVTRVEAIRPAVPVGRAHLREVAVDPVSAITKIQARLAPSVVQAVERAITKQERDGRGFSEAQSLDYFWRPVEDLQRRNEEEGGSEDALVYAIEETSRRVLPNRREWSFRDYSRTVLANRLGRSVSSPLESPPAESEFASIESPPAVFKEAPEAVVEEPLSPLWWDELPPLGADDDVPWDVLLPQPVSA